MVSAGKWPAGTHDTNVAGKLMAFPGPQLDRGVRPGDPGAIVAMQINRHPAERFAPVGDRAVIMRVRNGNRLETAERSDVLDHLIGEQGNAVPKHTPIRFPQQHPTSPDG